MGSAVVGGTLDFVRPVRSIAAELVAGRGHYERIIAAVCAAKTSVWIATATLKELYVEAHGDEPRARSRSPRAAYRSIVSVFEALVSRGVEIRILHGELPSRPFRSALLAHPVVAGRGGVELRRCPRVHTKLIVVDGATLYLGSANWTGAGVGARGSGKRNFELGIVTDDVALLDDAQALIERIWSGGECAACKLRDECPGPLDEL